MRIEANKTEGDKDRGNVVRGGFRFRATRVAKGRPLRLVNVHIISEYVHKYREGEEVMGTASLRHKHLQLDQGKLNRARRILGAKTETETLERALDLVVSEAEIDTALRKARGKGRIRKVFR